MVFDTQLVERSRVLPMAAHHVAPNGAAALALDYQRLDLLLPGAAAARCCCCFACRPCLGPVVCSELPESCRIPQLLRHRSS